MTGPVVPPGGEDEMRDALAAVLSDWRARYGRAIPEAEEMIAALNRRGVELTRKGHPDCVDAVKFVAEHHHGRDYPRCAAAIDREGRRRAAEELERLADSLTDRVRTWVLNLLRDRAAALAPEEARPE